jgi:glycosyltransferase involved in cell wall biosynthesis
MNPPKKRLLFLTSRFPFPLEKGDKLRAYHLIRQLSDHFDIILFALSPTKTTLAQLKALEPYCHSIHSSTITRTKSYQNMLLIRNLPFQIAYFQSEKSMQDLDDIVLKTQPDAVFCHLIRMAEYARRVPAGVKVIDYMDAFSKGMERMKSSTAWWRQPFVHREAEAVAAYEQKVFGDFGAHFIISGQDKDLMPVQEKKSIDIVPNGVDLSYFHPITATRKYTVMFNGHMAYPPNIASAVYTAKRIMPILRKKMPEANLLIAGAEPVREIRRLENSFTHISGWMDDIRLAFAESSVMVAPMLISIGLQNKILQAMAMGIPCVISTLANNAIGATPGK